MIARNRNIAIAVSIVAASMTVLCLMSAREAMKMVPGRFGDYVLYLYVASAVLWSTASFQLAKAKGYSSDSVARVLMLSFLFGFCCQPVAMVFPLLGFFLDDKHRPHRRSHRRRRRSSRSEE